MKVIEKTIINNKKEITRESHKNDNKLIYNLIGIFFVASIIGWIYEMIFYKVTENILDNRGFLYGPYVPVYGTGAVLIVLLLKRFRKNPVILFIGMMILTGIVEYIVGDFMLFVWNKRWWDYTGLFLNINGHVCLRSVISFAIGGLALIYLVEPFIDKINKRMGNRKKNIIYGIIIGIMIIDLIVCLIIRHPIKYK